MNIPKKIFLCVKTIFIILLFVLTIISCTPKTTKMVETPLKQEAIFAVSAYEVSRTVLSDYLDFGGDVVAASSVDILPDTAGKLSRVYVRVGDYVYKDQLLAEVDASRPGMTFSTNPIKAATQGTITSLPLSVGATVAPSMSIGKISSTSILEIKTAVAERFVSRIKIDQQASLIFDAWPNEIFIGKITEISPVLDPITRTMGVTLVLNPPDDRIKPGMYTRIKLITEEKEDVLVVPHYAIVNRSDNTFVFIAQENDTVQIQSVTTGLRVDDKIEISSGLKVGDIVITRGQTLLEDSAKINVISIETDSNTEGGD